MKGKAMLDQALVTLIIEGAEKHQLFSRPVSDLEDAVVDELFELTLDVIGDNNGVMKLLPKEKKIILIKQMVTNQEHLPKRQERPPSYYSDLLLNAISSGTISNGLKSKAEHLLMKLSGGHKNAPTLRDIILELKVQCQCQSVVWLKQFVDAGGLTNLFAVLESMHSKPGRRNKHFEIESETLKILRLISNCEESITNVLCQQAHLNVLILSLDSPAITARTATLDFLLAIVTLNYPTGHKLIMAAMEHFKTIRGMKRVFDILVESLSNAVSARGIFGSRVGGNGSDYTRFGFAVTEKTRQPTEKEIREYLVSNVALIRFLVEIPPEFEYRMHVRHELIAAGLLPIFEKLSTWAASEFNDILQHVTAFENLKTADFKYLLSNLDAELDVDLENPNQLLNLLTNQLDSNDQLTISSLIQNIVVGTSLIDSETRSYMLSMIEKAVTYIVLDQNGVTNFTDAFKYSVDQIISGLQEIEALQEENVQLSAICEHQEKQLLAKNENSNTGIGKNTVPDEISGITKNDLLKHKNDLQKIYNALNSMGDASFGRDNSNLTIVEDISKDEKTPTSATTNVGMIKPPPPPPLPQFGKLGPPPPPPPPPGIGNIPPPPGMPIQTPALKAPPIKYRPKSKTRKMHWERVDINGYDKSMWAEFNYAETEELVFKSGLLDELEANFAATEAKIPLKTAKVQKPEAESEIKILSEKRAQNLMILLGTLRDMTQESIIDSIRTFEAGNLSEVILQQCLIALPTPDEQKLFSNYSPNTNYRSAEKFVMMLDQIHRCAPRIKILIFKNTFMEKCNQLKLEIISSLKSLRCICESKQLKRILQIVLVIGNFLNSSTSAGISGFKISSLGKIIDMKSSGQTTVVRLLAKTLISTKDPLIEFIGELRPLSDIKNISLKGIEDDLNDIRKNYRAVKAEVEEAKKYTESPKYNRKDTLFVTKLNDFFKEVTTKVQILDQEYEDLMNAKLKLMEYFGEPPNSKVSIESIILDLRKFVAGVEDAVELENKKALQQKKLQAAKPKSVYQKPTEKSVTKPAEIKENPEQKRHLDNLLENLKNRPALESFELMQRPKQRDQLKLEVKKFPKTAPKPSPMPRKTSITSFSDETWKLLESMEFGELNLDFELK